MKKLNVLLIAAVAILMATVTVSFHNDESMAKTVVDDQNNVIEIPDKYFTNMPSPELIETQTVLCRKMQYYFAHPAETITDPVVLNEVGTDTINKALDNAFNGKEGQRKHAEILENFKSQYLNPGDRALRLMAGGLDTGKVALEGSKFVGILDPSDITVYNATGKKNVTEAIKYSMNEWSKTPYFNFRLVDDPKEARVIVGELNPGETAEEHIQGNFKLVSSYYNIEIQGKIGLSPNITNLNWDDTDLLHTVMHEMGHAVGRPDLYG